MADPKPAADPANNTPFDFLASVVNADGMENGVWVQLEYNGVPLFLDGAAQKQPCRVRVRSTNSTAFEGHLDKIQRRTVDRQRTRGGKLNKAQKEQLIRDLKEDGPESFAILVTGFDNVSKDNPGVIEPIREDLLHFAKNPNWRWAVDFALECAADEGLFGNVGNGDAGDSGAKT